MMFRGCLLALVLLSVEPSLGAQKLWSLKGRVLDQEGHPVAGVSVTTNWRKWCHSRATPENREGFQDSSGEGNGTRRGTGEE
jgi:hypothetical protein